MLCLQQLSLKLQLSPQVNFQFNFQFNFQLPLLSSPHHHPKDHNENMATAMNASSTILISFHKQKSPTSASFAGLNMEIVC